MAMGLGDVLWEYLKALSPFSRDLDHWISYFEALR